MLTTNDRRPNDQSRPRNPRPSPAGNGALELRRSRRPRCFRAYNFQEIRTPIFESTELFARGVGEETDIVSKEMYTWNDGERFDEDALRKEWISRGETENRFYVEAVALVNTYLKPLGLLLINHRPPRSGSGPDKPEIVCFRAKVTPEAFELLLKARAHMTFAEFIRQYGAEGEYSQRARLRIVVPSGTADSATWIDTHEVEIEQFQARTPVFKSSQSLTLRPENTAGVVRAYIEHKLWDRGLNKLYYIGPQFRRERPQKGRYRQFYQIGAEVIGPASAGSESPARDAEILEMLATLLDRLGITDWNLELNSVGSSTRPRALQRCAAQGPGAGGRQHVRRLSSAAPSPIPCASSTARCPRTSLSSRRCRASASISTTTAASTSNRSRKF